MKKENITKQIRSFNRFYTTHIGTFDQYYLESHFSLTEIRILYEIGETKTITAQELCEKLNLDKGYLSRILKSLLKSEKIIKVRSQSDGRVQNIELTNSGRELLKLTQNKVEKKINDSVSNLNKEEKSELTNSMNTIKRLLDYKPNNEKIKKITYRYTLKPGDLGYIIHLHGEIYEKESGFSTDFEGYVIKTFYDFLKNYSPDNDHIILAEYENEIVGCIAVVHHVEEAQLRWFLIQSDFRGTGIGKRLLNDALDYCKIKEYNNIYLTTSNIQKRAIDIYKKVGFILTESTEVSQWGTKFQEERYDLKL